MNKSELFIEEDFVKVNVSSKRLRKNSQDSNFAEEDFVKVDVSGKLLRDEENENQNNNSPIVDNKNFNEDSHLNQSKHIELNDSSAKTQNKSYKFHGIIYAITSAMFLSISSIFIKKAKLFSGSDQTIVRYGLQLISMIAVACYKGFNLIGEKQYRKLLVLRGLFGTIALIAIHFSVKFITPSDSVALTQSSIILVPFLARFTLKEKVNITHIVSLVLTISGVVLISQPSFLFPKPSANSNCTKNNTTEIICNKERDSLYSILGIIIALIGALTMALVAILLKQLSNDKVHYSLVVIYASYFGLPISIAISVALFLTGAEKKDPALYSDPASLTIQIVYSLISAISGIISQVLVNFAYEYEDTSKVTILRSTDLFFTFVFQYIILNLYPNIYSTIGALLIFLAALFIMGYKMLEKKFNNKKNNTDDKSILHRIFFFKI